MTMPAPRLVAETLITALAVIALAWCLVWLMTPELGVGPLLV
jgi:hypothetical protein